MPTARCQVKIHLADFDLSAWLIQFLKLVIPQSRLVLGESLIQSRVEVFLSSVHNFHM